MRSECVAPGCHVEKSPKAGRGLCMKHYNFHKARGTINQFPLRTMRAATAEEKFYRLITVTKSCWWWNGSKNAPGYGVLNHGRDSTYAHRWAWEHLVGEIPDGLTIDHLCMNKLCVNPEHLEVVPISVNASRRHGNRVFCPKGHSMDNAYSRPDGDGRQCATCIQERGKKKWANRKLVACQYCGKVLSDMNMRAHERKYCPNAPRPK